MATTTCGTRSGRAARGAAVGIGAGYAFLLGLAAASGRLDGIEVTLLASGVAVGAAILVALRGGR